MTRCARSPRRRFKLDASLSAFLAAALKAGKFPWASAPDLFANGPCDLAKSPDLVLPATCPPTATRQYARAHFVNELPREGVRREKSVRAYGAEVSIRFDARKAQFDADRKAAQATDTFRKGEALKLFKCAADRTSSNAGPDALRHALARRLPAP